jgi:acyl carrier protein
MTAAGKSVLERLRPLLAQELARHPETIVPQARMRDLGCDSLDGVAVAMRVEEDFGIVIADDELPALDTASVAGVVALIERKLAERK